MGRGGHRKGAGRKSGWNNSETQTIRVPKIFAVQILEYARQLDSESHSEQVQNVDNLESEQISLFDFEIANSGEALQQNDFVPNSKVLSLQGKDLAKRLNVNRGVPSKMKGLFRNSPQRFLDWSRGHDPDGFSWRFNPITRLYDPIIDPADDF